MVTIGKNVIAHIGENKPWVEYIDPQECLSNSYRIVYIDGYLTYCDGEGCRVLDYDEAAQTVTLSNFSGEEFTIPLYQYEADFGSSN